MSTYNDLRKKRIQLKRKLDSIILAEGQSWRDVKSKEKQIKEKFLNSWKKYNKNSQNFNEFLYSTKKLAEIFAKERIEHRKLEKKYQPCLNELVIITKKLEK